MQDGRKAQIREILASQQPAVPQVPPRFAEVNGLIDGPIRGVVREYAITLLNGVDLISNAKGWKDHKPTLTAAMKGFQLMLLACEDGSLGGYFIDKDANTEGPAYRRVVEAVARVITHKSKHLSEDRKIVKASCTPSVYLNLKHQRDIKAAIEMVNSAKADAPPPAESEALPPIGELMSMMEAIDEANGVVPDVPTDESLPAPPMWEYVQTFFWINRDASKGSRSELLPGYIDADNCTPDDNAYFNVMRGAVEVDQVDNNDEAVLVGSDYAGGETVVFPKVVVTVSAFKRKGVLVRFLQIDPTWNPGKKIHSIVYEAAVRKLHGTKANYQDPWPTYAHLYGSNFILHELTWKDWIAICNTINYKGKLSREARDADRGAGNRADNWNSPLHPLQVFTLDRALQRLRRVGVEVGNVDEWSNTMEGIASFPDDAVRCTIRYDANQVFWDHPEDVGFFHQTFPFTAMAHPALEQVLTENDVVGKNHLVSLLPQSRIKTSNMLVHLEYEADLVGHATDCLLPDDLYNLYKSRRASERYEKYRAALEDLNRTQMDKLEVVCALEGNVDYIPISAPMRATLKYMQDYFSTHKHNTYEVKLSDPNMDFFANAVSQELWNIYRIQRIVRPMMSFKTQGLFSVSQAFKVDLLFHLIYYGEGGAGKSVTGPRYVEKMCIPGTYDSVDRQTKAATQVDTATFDMIQIREEMPEAIVNSQAAKKDQEAVNMWKSATTSGKVNVETYENLAIPGIGDYRGKRMVECILKVVLMGTTNAGNTDNDAVASRLFKETICKSQIPPNELRYKPNPVAKKAFERSYKIYQAISYWTNKAMAIRAICSDCNMELWYDVAGRMFDNLVAWGVMTQDKTSRCMDIMSNFARQMVIKHAINMTYNIKGAPYYKKPFHPHHLKELQRYLYCTTQIALFTVTALSKEIVRDEFGAVLNAAFKLCCNTRQNWDPLVSPYDIYQRDTAGVIKWKLEDNPYYVKETQSKSNSKMVNLNYMVINKTVEEVAQSVQHESTMMEKDCLAAFMRMSQMVFPPTLRDTRNGYANVPGGDLEQHRGVEMPKITLISGDFRNQLATFISDMKLVYAGPVARKFDPMVQDEEDARLYLQQAKLQDADVVLLWADRTRWDGSRPPQETVDTLKASPVTKEKEARVMKSLQEGAMYQPSADYTETMRDMGLDYQYVRIIEMAFDFGLVKEFGVPGKTYLKRQILPGNDYNPFPHFACEDDIAQLSNVPLNERAQNTIKVVDIKRNQIAFSPMAIDIFDKNIVLQAFEKAAFGGRMDVGKRLLGWTLDNDSTKCQTVMWDDRYIRDRVLALNDDMQPEEDDDEEDEDDFNRLNGVPFKRRGATHAMDMEYCMFDEDYDHDEEQERSNLLVVDDLDRWSATVQHMRCGFSMDEPVHTPSWIRQNYRDHGGALGSVDYPKTIVDMDQKTYNKTWGKKFNGKRVKL